MTKPSTTRARARTTSASTTTPPHEAAPSGITDAWEYITPAVAMKLLETNVDNRPIQQSRVERYAEDMKRGAWRSSHQGIAIGIDGVLYDGQHRLWAVITAGVSVWMKVTRGLPPEARAVIDLTKPRTFVDSLAIARGVARSPRAVSWLRVVAGIEGHRVGVAQATMEALHDRFATTLDWMLAHGPKDRQLGRAAVLGALVYAHAVHADEVGRFVERYVSGENLDRGSPVLALRTYVLQKLHASRDPDRITTLKVLRCVGAFVDGEPLERIASFEEADRRFIALHERHAGDVALAERVKQVRGEE